MHLAATVRPRRAPFVPTGRAKARLLAHLKELGRSLERLADVVRVTVFDGIVLAPPTSYVRQHPAVHRARFDLVVLAETTSPQSAQVVRQTEAYRAVEDTLRAAATDVHVFTARNARRVADVDKTRPGLFLFNYFVGDDPELVVNLWDYLAGWYEIETGLDNSTLLVPVDGETADFAAVNNARWEYGLPRFLWRQLTTKTFSSYMKANLDANQTGCMPVLYRLA